MSGQLVLTDLPQLNKWKIELKLLLYDALTHVFSETETIGKNSDWYACLWENEIAGVVDLGKRRGRCG